MSLHHNSVGQGSDGNKATGTEVYFHHGQSEQLAESLAANISGQLGRKNRGTNQSLFRVTMLPHAPSVLIELGFLPNPVEYESAATPADIQKVAQAVGNAVIEVLR